MEIYVWDFVKISFFLGSAYFLTGRGESCQEDRYIGVETIYKEAAKELNEVFSGTENESIWPKGCYLAADNNVYFNHHSIGATADTVKQICKLGGKVANSFFTYVHNFDHWQTVRLVMC